jgi:hypothetical protein
MLLEIRKMLTPDQWKKVKAIQPEDRHVVVVQRFHGGPDGRKGDGPPPLPPVDGEKQLQPQQ